MTIGGDRASFLFGIAFLALGIYVTAEAFRWQIYGHDGPGPGFFPIVYGCCMALLGLALALKELFSAKATGASGGATQVNPALAFATLAALAASVPLMAAFGFVVGFGVALFFIIRFVFGQPSIRSAIVAISIVVACHVGFVMLLGASLPGGLFWGF